MSGPLASGGGRRSGIDPALLDAKADKTAVAASLATKADATALAAKADSATVNTALAGKAAQSAVDAVAAGLAGKAAQTAVDAVAAGLAGKAAQSAVDAVNAALGDKANRSEIPPAPYTTTVTIQCGVVDGKDKHDLVPALKTAQLGKRFGIHSASANVPVWVRLYATPAHATKDKRRKLGTLPSRMDHGVLYEWATRAGHLALTASPPIQCTDEQTPPDGLIALNVCNLSTKDRTVTLTLKITVWEA